MELATILEKKTPHKIYGLIGNINISTNNNNYGLTSSYHFSGTVKEYLNSPKAETSLKMVHLNSSYLNKQSNELSISDLNKISLAAALIANKDYLILNYFDKGLNYKEKEDYKRLFEKLANEYQKTILIFTNDITFLWDIAEEIMIVDKSEIINTIKKNNYFNILEFIDKPEIIKFIDLMQKKNIPIEYYKNRLDLLKAIYRLTGD